MSRKELHISTLRKITYSFVVLFSLLICSEFIIRIVCSYTNEYPNPFDKSLEHEWEWAERHLKEKMSYIPGSMYEYDVNVGWMNTANFESEVEEFDGQEKPHKTGFIKINSQQIRSDREYSLDPPLDKERILFVGDSYTFGVEVANHRIFPDILEKQHLPQAEVLNLAVPGTGTDQQVLTWEFYGKTYKPKIVILGFYVRDYTRNLITFKGYSKPCFVPDHKGTFQLVNFPVPPPQQIYEDYLYKRRKAYCGYYSYLANTLFARPYVKIQRRRSASAPGWKVLAYLMKRFTEGVRKANATPMWLVLPSRDSLEGEGDYDEIVALAKEKAQKLSLPFLDLTPHFKKHHQKNPHPHIYRPENAGGHLSYTGHKLVAQQIANFLQEKNLISQK